LTLLKPAVPLSQAEGKIVARDAHVLDNRSGSSGYLRTGVGVMKAELGEHWLGEHFFNTSGMFACLSRMTLSPDEFERLALEQLDMLYRIARRLTRNPDRAEDLVQETYLRALRGRDGFQLESFGIRPWLVRILQNLHFSRGARESREPVALEDAQLDRASASDAAPWSGDGFDGMDERLVHAVEELPDEYKTVLLLWSIEIPIGTVMSRLHRGRQRLAERLKDYRTEDRRNRE
jgi:RNA polymerase sigma-70 factor (ECF subfamily)